MTKTILILAANPQETGRLRLDKEVKGLQSVIRSSANTAQLRLENRGAVQLEDFQQGLLDVKPWILHFCGHSSEAGLVVEDDQGKAVAVPSNALISLFKIWSERLNTSPKIECVVLNSCHSQDIAKGISQYVKYVIGTHQQISDQAAIEFAKGFYSGLAAGESLEIAFKLGRNRLEFYQIPEHLTPVLIQNGQVIEERLLAEKKEIENMTFIDVLNSPRGQSLWKLAYTFLRLDQTPSGGWGKTLYTWMDLIGNGAISLTERTRFLGGTDLTAYTLYYYLLFLKKTLPHTQIQQLLEDNGVVDRVYDNFKGKTNFRGALGARQTPRGGSIADVPLRHTLMGFIVFLLYGEANEFAQLEKDLLAKTYNYLLESIPEWAHDESHLYAMVSGAMKLQELLSQDMASKQLTKNQIVDLREVLTQHIPKMLDKLNEPLNYLPRPAKQIRGPLHGKMFRPYYDYWRMERSNFLMYLPFMLTDDGQNFLPEISFTIKQRCKQIFVELLKEIELPYNQNTPFNYLIKYHRDAKKMDDGSVEAPRDWGLSAELAALLQTKAVYDLLSTHPDYEAKREALNRALIETFDGYSKYQALFTYTHGSSFGRALSLFEKRLINPTELESLDKQIDRLCSEGVTESGLTALIQSHICSESEDASGINSRSLRDLLLIKLESGEYTPDNRLGEHKPEKWQVCDERDWEKRIQATVNDSTVAFYESDLSDKHIKRYAENPLIDLTDKFQHCFEWPSKTIRTALDVGCGAGQYAELLVKMGFDVKLLDASKKMLQLACERLEIASNSIAPTNIFDDWWGYTGESFDLIFASAIMIHVPEKNRKHVYSSFHRLLKPGGYLFVNYKIGDHTLISNDGRFFAYYRDEMGPKRELESSGFNIVDSYITTNRTDMYGAPTLIRWANFYCTKG